MSETSGRIPAIPTLALNIVDTRRCFAPRANQNFIVWRSVIRNKLHLNIWFVFLEPPNNKEEEETTSEPEVDNNDEVTKSFYPC